MRVWTPCCGSFHRFDARLPHYSPHYTSVTVTPVRSFFSFFFWVITALLIDPFFVSSPLCVLVVPIARGKKNPLNLPYLLSLQRVPPPRSPSLDATHRRPTHPTHNRNLGSPTHKKEFLLQSVTGRNSSIFFPSPTNTFLDREPMSHRNM